MRIAICTDHGGIELKNILADYIQDLGYDLVDFGTDSEESVDYPDYAHPLSSAIEKGDNDFGIAICGSGNGISMTANKYPGIRAALCWNVEISKLARLHNNANICSIPARFVSEELAMDIVEAFFDTEYEGGRHQIRIEKIPIKNI